ncbi:SAWADEE domain [Dillenia turbinata]|uniref:SAWADEE domain n=1 Tax=Dillenia turbinata TaxID=194707 RepID=A0AAN8W5Q7_9MAGN
MGRPPSSGGPAFRFTPSEVAEMESCLQEHHNTMPARELLVALADKFSNSADRSGKIVVQMKQVFHVPFNIRFVWNWFQNRRYALRAKMVKAPGKLSVSPMPRDDSAPLRTIPQPLPAPSASGRSTPENSQMEFEAKSARDGAWYDVATFLSHRHLETGDPEVLVRFAGFGPEEDEWVNIRRHVRQRSLPCESSECVAVIPGDLVLCFQEGKEQALYFDAHVLDAQRRRHDVRGCRCRFLVRYNHDQSEEIVPLRKVCRRPDTDYRLQQLHAMNDAASAGQHNAASEQSMVGASKVTAASEIP